MIWRFVYHLRKICKIINFFSFIQLAFFLLYSYKCFSTNHTMHPFGFLSNFLIVPHTNMFDTYRHQYNYTIWPLYRNFKKKNKQMFSWIINIYTCNLYCAQTIAVQELFESIHVKTMSFSYIALFWTYLLLSNWIKKKIRFVFNLFNNLCFMFSLISVTHLWTALFAADIVFSLLATFFSITAENIVWK